MENKQQSGINYFIKQLQYKSYPKKQNILVHTNNSIIRIDKNGEPINLNLKVYQINDKPHIYLQSSNKKSKNDFRKATLIAEILANTFLNYNSKTDTLTYKDNNTQNFALTNLQITSKTYPENVHDFQYKKPFNQTTKKYERNELSKLPRELRKKWMLKNSKLPLYNQLELLNLFDKPIQ